METRIDKLTGKKVSLLGFGAMRLPYKNNTDEDIDYELSQKMIDYAIEKGVNYFDTAYPYHNGKSELFIGEALKKYKRDKFFIADKMPPWHLKSKENVNTIFQEQLQKCQVDYFDFYLCHCMSSETMKTFEQFDVIAYLDKQKKEKKIHHLGFSFHDKPEILEKVIELYNWDFAQIQLNYLDWELQDAKRQYEILEKNNIPCIVMEPVRGGILSQLTEESISLLKQAEPENSVTSWAIRYATTFPNVLTVLSGMSNMEQVKDNIKTMSNFKPLIDKDYNLINKALEIYKKNITIPCTGCRYCMECPSGVDIPTIFDIYNKYAISKNSNLFKTTYADLGENKQVSKCIRCNKCINHCPQSIAIPNELQTIKNKLENLPQF